MLRRFIQLQARWCDRFDVLFPTDWKVDGNRDFIDRVVPEYLLPATVVYDIGGGKQPLIARNTKEVLELKVIGVDIDETELAAAPAGCYDRTECADIVAYSGRIVADVVLCLALLEHVRNSEAALISIASTL
jgi:2-polyprenyl-3-methyl-5-hydroxy-6-metoxy-1,4-benzoquinol methylase